MFPSSADANGNLSKDQENYQTSQGFVVTGVKLVDQNGSSKSLDSYDVPGRNLKDRKNTNYTDDEG